VLRALQVEGHEETSWYHEKDEQATQAGSRPQHVRPLDDSSGLCSGHNTFLSVLFPLRCSWGCACQRWWGQKCLGPQCLWDNGQVIKSRSRPMWLGNRLPFVAQRAETVHLLLNVTPLRSGVRSDEHRRPQAVQAWAVPVSVPVPAAALLTTVLQALRGARLVRIYLCKSPVLLLCK
jgi:hypothetical protein